MKSSLIINSIDANNQARQKSFANINPNATDANVCTFAKKVNALTTNEFVSAIRVDKKPLDDSTPEPVVKQTPTLTLSEFTKDGTTYTATITYTGDGELTTTTGSIDDVTLIVEDDDGVFDGTISASEGTNYLAATCEFSREGQRTPNLTVGYFVKYNDSLRAPITYDGDGTLSTNYGTISGSFIVTGLNSDFSGTITASETDNFKAASTTFVFGKYVYNTVNSGVKLSGSNKQDYIYNTKATVTIDSGAGKDYISNSSNYVTISSGEDDDYIWQNSATVKIDAGAGNDTVQNYGSTVTIDAGAGNDIINNKDSASITVNSNSGKGVTFLYHAGDGNDIIRGFRSNSTLSIVGADYSTQISGADVLIHVGDNTITLESALGLVSTLHINNDEILPQRNISLGSADDSLFSWRDSLSVDMGDGDNRLYNQGGYYNTISTGAGNDSIYSNYGHSAAINTGDGNDTVYNYEGDSVTIDTGLGNDSIDTSLTKYSSINAGDGNDTVVVINSLYNTINADAGDDLIRMYNQPRSKVYGGTGNDTILHNPYLEEAHGYISMYGGEGNDYIYQSGYAGFISGDTGDDLISLASNASVSANSIFYNAGDGNDIIYGFKTSDTLYISGSTFTTAVSGNNVLIFVGNDTLTLQGVALTADSIHVNNEVLVPPRYVTLPNDGGTASISNRDSVTLVGGEGNDRVTLSNAQKASVITGAGKDYISASGDSVTIDTGLDNDRIDSSSNYSSINAGAGNDTINNSGANASINAGAGNDSVVYTHAAAVSVFAGAGNDTINNNLSANSLIDAGDGDNRITIDDSAGNTVNTGDGNNYISALKAPNLLIQTGAGSDTVSVYSHGHDTIQTGAGNDSVYTHANAVSVFAGVGNDTIYNNNLSDNSLINAGAGNDSIYNSGSTVTVEGGTGDDTIYNNWNFTTQSAWADDDGSNAIFKYSLGDGNDIIYGFKANSTLSIVGSTFTKSTVGNDVIVNVGSEYITIQGGATVSPLNIVSA